MVVKHYLCKLFGHRIVHSPPILFCRRCGWARHNPYVASGLVSHDQASHISPTLPADDAHITTSPIEHLDGSVTPTKLSFGTWEKIADVTIATATASITFTELDANMDGAYLLFWKIRNDAGVSSSYRVRFEEDTTNANYYSQYLVGTGTVLDVNRANDAHLVSDLSAGVSMGGMSLIFREIDGTPICNTLSHVGAQGSLQLILRLVSKTTVTNITSFAIEASQASGIGVGSRFIMCKVRTK